MERKFDIIGLTNALTDIVANVQESDLKALKIRKAFQNRLREIDSENFLRFVSNSEKTYSQAGSPANTVFNAAALGLRTGLLGTIGDDEIGRAYVKALKKSGVTPLLNTEKGKSGICYILVTPDGERTCLADIGVSGKLSFDLGKMRKTKLFHTSCYELATKPEKVEEALEYAQKLGSKISFDLADPSMIKKERETIERVVGKTHILFMTEEEAEELTGYKPEKALEEMSRICPVVALKKGSKGSVVRKSCEQYDIPIFPVKVTNTCGAGDAYASGFLFAYLRNFQIEECGYMASYIASRICSRRESHF